MKCPILNTILGLQRGRNNVFSVLVVFLLLLLVSTFTNKVKAQNINPLISFSIESCTLDAALEKLFADYELNVAFSKAEMSKIRIEKYSCSYKSVEEVLADLLKGTDYGFKRIGKQYVIRKNQLLANEPEAVVTLPTDPHNVVIRPKRDTVVSKTGDTIRILDTVQIIKTVMRYNTLIEVQHEVRTDTVYQVKYKGLQIPWPKFRDNGWFITPFVAIGSASFNNPNGLPQLDNGMVDITPSLEYSLGFDNGYKHKRFGFGMSLAYRSVRYRFLLEKKDFLGDYYVNDTLDTYYVVHETDTAYHYILDSTYVPLTTTNYAYRDINQLDYLNVGLFASFDFIRKNHFRLFAKVGFSADLLINYGGSLIASESPYHAPIARNQVEPTRISYYGGLGMALKIVNRVELVPEVHYRVTNGSLYRADGPFDMTMRLWDFRLGLTYYF